MATLKIKEKLRDDISVWFAAGVIDQKTLDELRELYQSEFFV